MYFRTQASLRQVCDAQDGGGGWKKKRKEYCTLEHKLALDRFVMLKKGVGVGNRNS